MCPETSATYAAVHFSRRLRLSVSYRTFIAGTNVPPKRVSVIQPASLHFAELGAILVSVQLWRQHTAVQQRRDAVFFKHIRQHTIDLGLANLAFITTYCS